MGFDAWEPYQYMDVGNEVMGIDIELARHVTQAMGCELEYVQATWLELLQGVEEGTIDMLVGASKTEERESYAYFSNMYREESFALFVRQGEQHRYADFETLGDFVDAGYKLGIVNQYYYGDSVQAITESANYQEQISGAMISELNLARLIDQDVDGILEDERVGLSMIRRKGLSEYVTESHINTVASPIFAMFSRESVNEELIEEFNRELAVVHANGTYAEIVARYGL
ncbi:transporter substrate-binding domain-containing protein [Lysobacter sp. N42]|nr:transporter substrate-binding domain-containing protein [Aliidiomarina sp. B3213]TCZ93400.1 transporter substrate-binding domain-containing protein [Lysobacter sp. N42]